MSGPAAPGAVAARAKPAIVLVPVRGRNTASRNGVIERIGAEGVTRAVS